MKYFQINKGTFADGKLEGNGKKINLNGDTFEVIK